MLDKIGNNSSVFNMPSDYFEHLSSKVLNRIHNMEETETTDLLQNTQILDVPEKYFEENSKILMSIPNTEMVSEKAECELMISNPFQVPTHYFLEFQEKMVNHKSIRFNSKIRVYSLWHNAMQVAASLLFFALAGIYFMSNSNTSNVKSSFASTDLKQAEIDEYLQNEMDYYSMNAEFEDVEIKLDGVSQAEITDFLNEEELINNYL